MKTKEFDMVEYLNNEEIIAGYLEEVKRESPNMFARAYKNAIEATIINEISAKTGIKRNKVYKILKDKEIPDTKTVNKILKMPNILQPKLLVKA
jgi:probable addiction module antidote protein